MIIENRHKLSRTLFVAVVFILFSLMFWPFFTAILLAALFAFALHDAVSKLETKKVNRLVASLSLMSGLLLFIAFPIIIVILKVTSKVNEYAAVGIKNTDAYKWTEQIIHEASVYISSLASSIDLDISTLPKPVDFLNDYAGTIGSYATGFLTQLPRIGLNLIVFLFALFYFLYESKKIKNLVFKFNLLSVAEVNKLIGVIKKSSFLTLVASVSIAFVQALIISIFSIFCGFNDFFTIFIVTFVFALIPVVGSAPPALFLILVSFIQGNTGAGIALIVAFILASSSDNVIKAFALKSSNDQIHPIVSLLALIGAILIYGAPGILLGPIITQLAFNVLPIFSVQNTIEEIKESTDF